MSRAAVNRMKDAYGLTRDQELARRLKVCHSTPYNWAKRGLPVQRAYQAADDTGRLSAWILYGDGDPDPSATAPPRGPDRAPPATLPDHITALLAGLPAGTQATITLPDGTAVQVTLAAPAA
jgi:hypothetical protein